MPSRRTVLIFTFFAMAFASSLWPGGGHTSATGEETALSAGFDHTCALTAAGGVQCWGNNMFDELGDGTDVNSSTPVNVCAAAGCASNLSAIRAVSTGRAHTCALTLAGGVKCWGDNSSVQLGDGMACGRTCSTPVDVTGLASGGVAISAGRFYTCAVLETSELKCWGTNYYGQLATGDYTYSAVPVSACAEAGCAAHLSGVASVATERYHACAVTKAGALLCWGDNASGELGTGTNVATNLPVSVCAGSPGCVDHLFGVAAVSLGLHHACALMKVGTVKCWGDNAFGQLGNGTLTPSDVPVDVRGLASGVVAISVGQDYGCALTKAGHVKCWGDNAFGELGNGTITGSRVPVDVCADASCAGNLSGLAAITAGANHVCAVMEAGGIKCWGRNVSGQLGDRTTTDSPTPVDVATIQNALPDLVVTGMRIEWQPGSICFLPGTPSGVRVNFANAGTGPAGPFVVEVRGRQQAVPRLVAGASASVFSLGDSSPGETTATIDATFLVTESDETNNSLTQSLAVPTPPVSCTPNPTPTPTPRAGDANCDGSVNSIDAALALQFSAGLIGSLRCQGAADANHDGSVNAIDAALILQYVAGLLPALP